MATSGYFYTGDAGNFGGSPDRMQINWQRVNYNQAGNYSVIEWQVRGTGGSPGYWTTNYETRLTIDGSTSAQGQTQMYHDQVYFSGTKNVYHDSNGYATLNMSATGRIYSNVVNSSGSGSWALPRIAKAPTVSTNTVTNVQDTQATFGGNITDSGGASVTDAGVYISATDTTPDSNDIDADSNGDHTGGFSSTKTGLTPNTLYYYRAYATNSQGTSYGAVKSFTTNELGEVVTNDPTNIAGTTVTFNGNLTNNGRPDITTKGFCYSSTSSTPDLNSMLATVDGSATGVYSKNITGLSPATTYYVRAFATNSEGTVFGEVKTFQTVVLATVTTGAATDISTSAATLHGVLADLGGGSIIDYGFVWGTAANPTTDNSKKSLTGLTGAGSFEDTVTTFSPSTIYYVRAFVENEAGVSYGNQVSFDTTETAPTQPTIVSPKDNIAVDDLAQLLDWEYNPGSANDTQKAYQVIIQKQSDGTTVWDSGKVTSGQTSVNTSVMLVDNPNFDSNVVGWEGFRTTVTWDDGQAIGTPDAGEKPIIRQSVTFDTTKTYTAVAKVKGPAGTTAYLGSFGNGTGSAVVMDGNYKTVTFEFTPTVSSSTIEVKGNTANAVMTLDSVALFEKRLVFDTSYQWKVRTYSQSDLVSPYSNLAVFKTTQRPTLAITSPVDGAQIPSDTPTFTWSYSDPEGSTQSEWRVRILKALKVVKDTGWQLGSNTSYQVPADILYNFQSYTVEVQVKDAAGLESAVSVHSFSVSFLAPEVPAVGISQDTRGVVDLTIDLLKPPTSGWFDEELAIYRKNVNDVNWERIDTVPVESTILMYGNDDIWAEGANAYAPVDAVAKYGSSSLGIGAKAAGDALYTSTDFNNGVFEYYSADITGMTALQSFIKVADNSKFTSIDLQLFTSFDDYYEISIPAGQLVNNSWASVQIDRSDWVEVGAPTEVVQSMNLVIKNAAGIIAAGDIMVDILRVAKTHYNYFDYYTGNGDDLVYGVSSRSNYAAVSSAIGETEQIIIDFAEATANTYLVPVGDEAKAVGLWHDGDNPPAWQHNTDTAYHQPLNASKPVVFVAGDINYRTGSITLMSFDNDMNAGPGLSAIDTLELIKNHKPLVLRGWWGRNYTISIDGQISVKRLPGVAWEASFSFTEIEG